MLLGLAPDSQPAAAQAPRTPLRVWVAGGMGGARGSYRAGGVGPLVQIVVQRAPHQVTLRGLYAADPISDVNSPGLGELGLLYGRTATAPLGHVTLSTGLAMVGFDSCPGDSGASGSCQTVGLPIVAEGALHAFNVVGLGVQGFANLNSRASYAGAMLFLQLGWMR